MKITWLGHSCFILESNGYRVMLDPYHEVPGLPDVSGEVNAVLCSHDHRDHGYVEQLRLLGGDSPFTCQTIHTFHDAESGTQRGENLVHRLTAEGISLVHLGDLGHLLTPQQVEEITPCTVLMIPVGGTYTVDSAEARAVVEQLQPKIVIPMHYRDGQRGYPVLQPVSAFLSLFPTGLIRRYDGNTLTVDASTPQQVAVLSYIG